MGKIKYSRQLLPLSFSRGSYNSLHMCAQVRSRFTQDPGEEKDVGKANSQHLQPFIKCLARLGFTLQVRPALL
jgi:hypothetical protein